MMAPFLVAFKPAPPGGIHPAPWRSAGGGTFFDVTAQLTITAPDDVTAIGAARVIVFLLRLWNTPKVVISALSSHSFAELPSTANDEARIAPYEVRKRFFSLNSDDGHIDSAAARWVADHWRSTVKLVDQSNEFRFAMDALEAGQFIPNSALILVSLWGALEGFFAPSTAELKFRVSSLLASYLEDPGPDRLTLQKEAVKLYDRRSKAAHGKPDHSDDDLLATFTLLRRVLIKVVANGSIPTKEELETLLLSPATIL